MRRIAAVMGLLTLTAGCGTIIHGTAEDIGFQSTPTGATVSVEDLQQCVKAQLRSSRVPQHILFKAELPYNELGKVLRRVIRQEFMDQAGRH